MNEAGIDSLGAVTKSWSGTRKGVPRTFREYAKRDSVCTARYYPVRRDRLRVCVCVSHAVSVSHISGFQGKAGNNSLGAFVIETKAFQVKMS